MTSAMRDGRRLEKLLRQIAELPDEDRAELLQSLIETGSVYQDFYQYDEERGEPTRSAEDVRPGPNADIEKTVGRNRP